LKTPLACYSFKGTKERFSPSKGAENGWQRKKMKKVEKKLLDDAASLLPSPYNCNEQDISNKHLAESFHRLDSPAGQAKKNHPINRFVNF